jgi:CheY-like chemotaxis protein
LAQRLGGDICARSTPGQGSTFTVTVAAEPLQRDGSPTAAESSAEAAEISTLQLKGRVLLAEDDQSIQALMQRALAAVGLEVDVAADGLVACEKALRARDRAMPYDVILMDIKMPRLDGFAAARRLRAAGWSGPVLALSAHAGPSVADDCREAGCDDYLLKPMSLEELVRQIGRHLPGQDR